MLAAEGVDMTLATHRNDVDDAQELHRILRVGGIHTVFQPIVDLDSRVPVGFEALARGPVGSPLETPDTLFATAYREGRVAELDWQCQHAALQTTLDVGLPGGCWLSINTEPETLGLQPPSELARLRHTVESQIPLVIEITERDVTARPAELLHTVRRARARGARIALDDVGADPRVLAVLPLVAPDIIKLDLRLVQQRPSAAVAEVVAAVNAQAERTGAVILAEGIEDEAHMLVARALGATLGQGWLFGRPGALRPAGAQRPRLTVPASARPLNAVLSTPFELARSQRDVRVGNKTLLIELSKHLERDAEATGVSCMVVAAFQHARYFTTETAQRYARLAARTAFVAALGEAMPARPLADVRGGALEIDDPVIAEWDVVVIGPRTVGALTARDMGDGGDESTRRFEFVLTYDLPLAVRMAASLLYRIAPES